MELDLENEVITGPAELITQKQIKDTPFTAVKVDNKYFLTCGKYRVSAVFGSFEECEEDAKDTSWNRLSQVIMAIAEGTIQNYLNNQNKKDNE